MNIIFKPDYYGGRCFIDEKGERVSYEKIKDNFYLLEGRKGKLIYKGQTSVQEHGYNGYYYNYGFVFQDDLSSEGLHEKVELKSI